MGGTIDIGGTTIIAEASDVGVEVATVFGIEIATNLAQNRRKYEVVRNLKRIVQSFGDL